MHQSLNLLRRLLMLPALLGLAACGAIQAAPEPALPRALVQPLSAQVGVVLDEALRGYHHEESRHGSRWNVSLGPGHVKMMQAVFGAAFSDARLFDSLDEARAAGGLQAIFEPGIEQFSFATDRDTSGYWAATLRYRIPVYAPDGTLADTLLLTGYGSAREGGGKAGGLTRATVAAMRDAAAKFLVQLPRQGVARQLAAGEAVRLTGEVGLAADAIEVVPIEP